MYAILYHISFILVNKLRDLRDLLGFLVDLFIGVCYNIYILNQL